MHYTHREVRYHEDVADETLHKAYAVLLALAAGNELEVRK